MTTTTTNTTTPGEPHKHEIVVAVTGAAGQIGYALLPLIARGLMFGHATRVHLRLLEIPPALPALQGLVMELRDGAYPLLADVVCSADPDVAFERAHAAILVGAFPRKAGMERADLLKKNANIFKTQGQALARVADPNVKVVVVGNPANTNAFILSKFAAPKIHPSNITALTRLDHNRLLAYLANALAVPVTNVHNVCIWGNHSSTQYPDVTHAIVHPPASASKLISHSKTSHHPHHPAVAVDAADVPSASSQDPAATHVNTPHNEHSDCKEHSGGSAHASTCCTTGQDTIAKLGGLTHIRETLIPAIQGRGAEIIRARGASSALSAASAIVDHMHSWFCGDHRTVSMAIFSDGKHYGIPEGLYFSYPVRCAPGGKYTIVENIHLDEFSRQYIDNSAKELLEERVEAEACLVDN